MVLRHFKFAFVCPLSQNIVGVLLCVSIWHSISFAVLYGSLLLLGGVCLLITVAVSLFLPELRRRIHNKIALSHNFSLMIAYFAWGTAQLSPNLGDNSCIFLSMDLIKNYQNWKKRTVTWRNAICGCFDKQLKYRTSVSLFYI